MSFDWKKTLGAIAPIAGTMIGGPFGAIAGAAVGKIFGHEEGVVPNEREMEKYIAKATPGQLEALKRLDAELEIKMEELEIKREQLSFDDTSNARAMQKENKSFFPAILCSVLVVGFFITLYCLMQFEIPDSNKAVVYTMIGTLGTLCIASVQFWVGTTKGSSDKNNMLSGTK